MSYSLAKVCTDRPYSFQDSGWHERMWLDKGLVTNQSEFVCLLFYRFSN